MKFKIWVLLCGLLLNVSLSFSNTTDSGILKLSKIYKNYMFRNQPSINTYEIIQSISDSTLLSTKQFVKECISNNNALNTKEFLSLPNEETLKKLFYVIKIQLNMGEKNPKDNISLLTGLRNQNIPRYELIENYYSMLFSGIGNKNQPFNLSQIDYKMEDYNFIDDTEKGIFFLIAMNLCYTQIWGYMNIVKPPNYKKALFYIKKFPKFDGQNYYMFQDFGFKDFEMEIEKGKGKESFKNYLINRFYNTLIYHHRCLNQKKKTRKEAENLALSSILRTRNYYDYAKDKSYLNGLFRTMKMD